MRIEIRSDSVVLDGYVNVTDRLSRELSSPQGNFVEAIMPRTFERALMTNPNVDLLFNHNQNRKLGSTKTGELSLHEDNIGLRATATVTDPEIIDKARKGELRGWSFGFQVLRDNWEQRQNAVPKRTVEEINLGEVSVLDITPAYIATSIEARGDQECLLEMRNEEFQTTVEDKTEISTEPNKVEEIRGDTAQFDYSTFENEITLLQLRGL